MGCDIHLVLEQRHPDFGWVGIDTFRGHHTGAAKSGDDYSAPAATSRNYRLFAALAGVRGEGPTPRGLPDDASQTTKMLARQWDGDAHSHSWIPLADAAREFNKRRWPEEKPADSESWRDRFPASYWFGVDSDDLANYRLVFWFDN